LKSEVLRMLTLWKIRIGRSFKVRERVSELLEVLEIEFSIAYRFPHIELLVAAIIVTSGIGVLSIGLFNIGLNLGSISNYNSTLTIELYSNFVGEIKTLAYIQGLAISANALILLVSLFVAFSFARNLEDGTLRTFLSYPIKRSTLVSIKLLLLLVFTSIPIIITTTIWVEVIFPAYSEIGYLVLAISSCVTSILLVSTISLFVAIISKRSSATVFVGTIYWIVLLLMANSSITPDILNAVFNPVQFVYGCLIRGELDTLVLELIGGFVGALVLSIVLFFVSLKMFSRMEV
jgi:ABC-type transport system involved in multi-copper enzyme maturation permease subunit